MGRPIGRPFSFYMARHIMPNATAKRLFDLASTAAQRNIQPIVKALSPLLPDDGTVLEIAAGAGYHTAVLAAEHSHLTWQMSDASDDALIRMAEIHRAAALPNLRAPVELNVTAPDWNIEGVSAILCCNMIHIAPWQAAEGLFAGAARVLSPSNALFLYGPFSVDGSHTSESNASFDAGLRARNPAWGVRDSRDVDGLASRSGFDLDQTIAMPANNMMRVYLKAQT
jgi:hypothetical protein